MQRVYIHPLPVRIWHWTNATGFVLMILTGVQIRYVGIISVTSFRTAVMLHNWIACVLMANFCLWLAFYLFTDKIKVWHPELDVKKHFAGSFRQAYFYGYGIFKGDPNPFHVTAYRKFNPLQSMLYQVIMMLLIPIQIYTGILMWDVKGFAGQVDFFGGVRVIDTVHVLIWIFFLFFIPFHAYLGTLGETVTAHFKAMWTGYEEIEAPEEHAAAGAEHAPARQPEKV